MTEQNEIITPVFKNKASDFKKHVFTARHAVKINVNEVELTIFIEYLKIKIYFNGNLFQAIKVKHQTITFISIIVWCFAN